MSRVGHAKRLADGATRSVLLLRGAFRMGVGCAVAVALAVVMWSAPVAHSQAERRIVGVQLPLSGPVAAAGFDCRDGLEIAFQELPPHLRERVSLEFEDDELTPRLAVGIARNFMRRDDLLAIFTFSTNIALAVSPVVATRRIPMFALSGHPRLLMENPDVYDHWPEYAIETEHYLALLKERNPERVAIITLEHDYTLALRDLFVSGAKRQGREVAVDEVISGQSDMRSIVSKITNRRVAFVFLNIFEPTFSSMVRNLRQLRFKGTIITHAGNVTDEFFVALGPDMSSGITFFSPEYRYATFEQSLRRRSRKPQDIGTVFACYIGARRLVAALSLVKGDLSSDTVRAALSQVKQVALDGREFGMRDRRIQFEFVRGESLNGTRVFRE